MRKPKTQRPEIHFMQGQILSDLVMGMSDGLTVPFALAAGLSGARASAAIVVLAGLSEIAAGTISMGLGGYLSEMTDLQHYRAERQREVRETREVPDTETQEVKDVLTKWGLEGDALKTVANAIRSDRDRWVDFMMRFELGLEQPEPSQARRSAVTIGVGYALGGFVPLLPYIILNSVSTGLIASIVVTTVVLALFGFAKSRLIGVNPWLGALQHVVLGGLAAGVAFGLALLIATH
jgi:VIT1/CCC1 family predicted Fe2+/Mn2+ transporter